MGELRAILADEEHPHWIELATKVAREARDDQVWSFLPWHRFFARYPEIRLRLGRRRAFWDFLVGEWRDLGLAER